MKNLIILIAAVVLATANVNAQGLTAAEGDKAVVYFARVSSMGFAIPFDFFHERKYIGDFAGKNYLRYECEPGQHLFWASSENKEFLTADLKAGGTYVVIVDVEMGIGIARVGFTPISPADTKLFQRAKKLIDKKAPVAVSQAEIDRENERLADFITEKLQRYNDDWKQTKDFKHLPAEMTIGSEFF